MSRAVFRALLCAALTDPDALPRMPPFADPLTARISDFLQEIGVGVRACALPEPCFLPGIHIQQGKLLVDETRLLYPGDLLHEAGHLAITPAPRRVELHGDIGSDLGEEIGAIWSSIRRSSSTRTGTAAAPRASSTTSSRDATWAFRCSNGWR